MTREYSSDLYPREAVIKAAYAMIDRYYVHLDYYDGQYIMELSPKEPQINDEETRKLLDNEMIYQLARFTVSERTADVRKIVLARAFSSAMIAEKEELPEYSPGFVSKAENILKDWFETHEQQ